MNPDWVDVFPIEHGDIPAIAMLLGGGFKYSYFRPYQGKRSNLTNIYQKGLKPPTSFCLVDRTLLEKWM